jgi:hypothetical protein
MNEGGEAQTTHIPQEFVGGVESPVSSANGFPVGLARAGEEPPFVPMGIAFAGGLLLARLLSSRGD